MAKLRLLTIDDGPASECARPSEDCGFGAPSSRVSEARRSHCHAPFLKRCSPPPTDQGLTTVREPASHGAYARSSST